MNETKYTVKPTAAFRKDYKRAKKRHLPIDKLKEVVAKLAMGEPLPEKNKDHAAPAPARRGPFCASLAREGRHYTKPSQTSKLYLHSIVLSL